MKVCVSLAFFPDLGTLYLLLGCLVQQDMKAFALSVYTLFCTYLSLVFCKPTLFRRGNEVGVDKREREGVGGLGGVEGGEIGARNIV